MLSELAARSRGRLRVRRSAATSGNDHLTALRLRALLLPVSLQVSAAISSCIYDATRWCAPYYLGFACNAPHATAVMRPVYNLLGRRLARTPYFTSTLSRTTRTMTTTATDNAMLSAAAQADAARIEAERKAPAAPAPITVSGSISHKSIDLDSIGAVDAKTLMSAEHKALGYRPPPGSLAAEAQAAAAKHPDAHLDVDPNVLREAAREDAARIAAERKNGDNTTKAVETHAAIDFDQVGEGELVPSSPMPDPHGLSAEAKAIMSAEHKALGYRPPPGSLAAEAQAAAAKHPHPDGHLDPNVLREAAREDAARIACAPIPTPYTCFI
jgi:hypothetical protein